MDPKSEIAFDFHIGTWSENVNMWSETCQVFLPDGSFVVSRTVGNRPGDRGPGGGCMNYVCEEAGKVIHLTYCGPGRFLSVEEAYSGNPLTEMPYERLDVDLRFEAITPIWDFGGMEGVEWAAFHYQQTGTLKGSISFRGETYKIDTFGERDHSRGPRDYGAYLSSHWLQAFFPEQGRIVSLHQSRVRGSENYFSLARVYQNEESHIGTIDNVIRQFTSYYEEYGTEEIKVSSDLGMMNLKISVPQKLLPTSFSAPHEVLYGTHMYENWSKLGILFGILKVEWDGHVGWGWNDFCFNLTP